jgi:PAS domain S-box-containing protein
MTGFDPKRTSPVATKLVLREAGLTCDLASGQLPPPIKPTVTRNQIEPSALASGVRGARMLQEKNYEDIVMAAVAALQAVGEGNQYSVLEQLPAPIYVTDADGVVIYYNRSCVEFAGRTPAIGKDRWCVTWKLYTDDGRFLPHDCCPMAEAIKTKRPLRGLTALAERPDGTRVRFSPFPTPLLSADGQLKGAVNMLIDITEEQQVDDLRSQAARCRRLADASTDSQLRRMLLAMAVEYQHSADLLVEARVKARCGV